jgi:hypothetical protein
VLGTYFKRVSESEDLPSIFSPLLQQTHACLNENVKYCYIVLELRTHALLRTMAAVSPYNSLLFT